jgi:ubiquitin carboxyl-terminal hydrolase 4/11/15
LYAAVCTGSFASFLDRRIINHLGYQDQITETEDGIRKIKLPVYLPEAVPLSQSSRSNSPAPQLPSLNVEFQVVERANDPDSKAIQIFLGSDMLRAHNADILFSSNHLTLYDDDRSKLQIPLVRPEDERTFKSLFITSGFPSSMEEPTTTEKGVTATIEPETVGEGSLSGSTMGQPSTVPSRVNGASTTLGSDDGSTGRRSLEQRPLLGLSTTRIESKDGGTETSPASAAPRSGPSPAIWSNWRRDTEKSGSVDWANVGKAPNATYQRRDTGIKVLKPMKPGSRTLSSGVSQSSSPATAGQSRFFDEGNRRTSNASGTEASDPQLRRSVSGEKGKDGIPTLTKTRSANPVGGASAFAWLNNGGK